MPKRRRERDKPKSGPEALYDPNKRVLLSYASDEEETTNEAKQPPVDAEEATVDDRTLANYQMDEYVDSEDDVQLGAAAVDAPEPEDEEEDEEMHSRVPAPRIDDRNSEQFIPRKDPVTQQWTTLGPVSYGGDEDEEDEYDPETEEAMAYLRAVRSERHNIPEILSAPHQLQADADHLQDTNHRNPDEDHVDLDDDSADTSSQVAPLKPTSTSAEDDARDPQRVFTRLLMDRFLEQRKQLHASPSMHMLAEIPDSCPISFPRGNKHASAEWHLLLSTKAPLPSQLQSMDRDSVINLLELVQRQYLSKNCKLSKVTSAWIWSLLARLDDVGTMTNDEVFPIRELGKRAVFLLLSFTNPELAAGLETLEQEALPAAGESVDTSTDPATPTENTLATLDMILVVIGEAFGQRDLLEFRPTWMPTEKPSPSDGVPKSSPKLSV